MIKSIVTWCATAPNLNGGMLWTRLVVNSTGRLICYINYVSPLSFHPRCKRYTSGEMYECVKTGEDRSITVLTSCSVIKISIFTHYSLFSKGSGSAGAIKVFWVEKSLLLLLASWWNCYMVASRTSVHRSIRRSYAPNWTRGELRRFYVPDLCRESSTSKWLTSRSKRINHYQVLQISAKLCQNIFFSLSYPVLLIFTALSVEPRNEMTMDWKTDERMCKSNYLPWRRFMITI